MKHSSILTGVEDERLIDRVNAACGDCRTGTILLGNIFQRMLQLTYECQLLEDLGLAILQSIGDYSPVYKKLLLTLFPFFAVACNKSPKPSQDIIMMDPKDLLFSLATLCDQIPSTQSGLPKTAYKALHEDDWRQIEFVPIANGDYIQSKLNELAVFKQSHSRGQGFTEVFIRPEHPITIESDRLAATQLPHFSESALSLGGNTVPGGYARSDGGDWFIYGQRLPDGLLLHVSISPGHGVKPSEPFLRALTDLAAKRFLLVDWYANVVVDTTSPESILTWANRYQ